MRTTGHLASTHAVDWFGQCSGHACVGHAFSAPMDWRHGRAVVGECRRMAWMGCPGSGHECGAASGVASTVETESQSGAAVASASALGTLTRSGSMWFCFVCLLLRKHPTRTPLAAHQIRHTRYVSVVPPPHHTSKQRHGEEGGRRPYHGGVSLDREEAGDGRTRGGEEWTTRGVNGSRRRARVHATVV